MQVKGTEWKFGLIFKSKEKKRYVAQQRVHFTKKEGIFDAYMGFKDSEHFLEMVNTSLGLEKSLIQ